MIAAASIRLVRWSQARDRRNDTGAVAKLRGSRGNLRA